MLLQGSFLSSGAEIFHAIPEGLAALPVSVLHQLCQHLLLHQPDFSIVGDPKGRIQTNLIKMIPQQKKTKAVDGSDLRIVQQRSLSLNML